TPPAAAPWRSSGHHPGVGDDRASELAEAVDGKDDLVARLEPPFERRIADLEQATRPDRSAPDQVTRSQMDVGRGALEHLAERERGVAPSSVRNPDPPAVGLHAGGHRQVEALAGSGV